MGLEKFLDLLIIRVRKAGEVSEEGGRLSAQECIWEHGTPLFSLVGLKLSFSSDAIHFLQCVPKPSCICSMQGS